VVGVAHQVRAKVAKIAGIDRPVRQPRAESRHVMKILKSVHGLPMTKVSLAQRLGNELRAPKATVSLHSLVGRLLLES
jgi:hypothetical protein